MEVCVCVCVCVCVRERERERERERNTERGRYRQIHYKAHSVCVCVSVYVCTCTKTLTALLCSSLSPSVCECVGKRQYLRERAVLDWCVPPAWPFLLRTATLLCLMMPHPSWSAERYAGRCVCVHKASILGATTQHLTQPLITLYLAPSMCVSICVCECESEGSYAPINIKYRYPCQWITSSDPISSS